MAGSASGGARDVKEDLDALRSDLDSLRKHFDALVAQTEATVAYARAASNGERDAKEDFGALRADLDPLRKDFGTFVSTSKNNASGRTEAQLDAIRQRIAALTKNLISQTTGQQQGKVERKVQERPLMSLAIVFATGFVAGRLLARR